MTTGTITSFNAARGTGTVACTSGGRFPFTARGASLAVGDAVTFRATGGLAGLYALDVRRCESTSAVVRPPRAAHVQRRGPSLAGGWSLAT